MHVFVDSYYMVYLNSHNRLKYFFNVSFLEGRKVGVVVGNFGISRNIPVEIMRDAILEKAEEIIRSNDVVLKEIPVCMAFDEMWTDAFFGRRV